MERDGLGGGENRMIREWRMTDCVKVRGMCIWMDLVADDPAKCIPQGSLRGNELRRE